MSKPCSKCGIDKPLEEFYRQPRGLHGRYSICKPCASRIAKAYYDRNRVERQRVAREYNKRYPERTRAARRRSNLKRLYGITEEQYEALFVAQGGCAVCGHASDGQALHVDHDHETGAIRGLLCGSCNTAIGLLRDDPKRAKRAAEYLHSPPALDILCTSDTRKQVEDDGD